MVIAHTYYTAGMHELAKVFVDSFCYYHTNDHIPLFIDAVGITDAMKDDLFHRYPYVTVRHHSYAMDRKAKKCGVSVDTLKEWRNQVEHNFVTQKNRAWKLMIAGEDRVAAVFYATKHIACDPNVLLAHFDIDTLFRSSIASLEQEISGCDVALKLRPAVMPIKARITIDMMALWATANTNRWLADWLRQIHNVAPLERPIGFGQISCWEAYKQALDEDRLNAVTLPLKYGLPGRNKPADAIWCGNVHNLTKDKCSILFGKELARAKEAPNEQR